LIKANVSSRNSPVPLEIDICPVCDVEKMHKNMGSTEKSIPLDKYGFEKLEK
jgi:hypothetical protein